MMKNQLNLGVSLAPLSQISSIAKNIQEDAIATSVLDEFWKKTNTTESIYAIWRYAIG